MYSLGRADYGRLGLGEGAEEKSEPTLVTGMEPASSVACGASVSFAVTREGEKQRKGIRSLSDQSWFHKCLLKCHLLSWQVLSP